MKYLLPFLVLSCAACTQVPELNERVPPDVKTADYPDLVPLDEALGPPDNPEDEAKKLEDSLQARREALAARAQKLKAPIVDEAARSRLNDEIPRQGI